MKSVINRVELIKPSFFKASPLLIAKMATDKLKNYSMYKEAEFVAGRITGSTSVEKAYEITSEFVKWKNHEQ